MGLALQRLKLLRCKEQRFLLITCAYLRLEHFLRSRNRRMTCTLQVWFANLFVLTGLFIGQCRVGQFMIQNCKVVHWPDKQPETAELKWLIRDESIQSSALSYPNRILLLLLTISCPV
jgi:hypothetical protein